MNNSPITQFPEEIADAAIAAGSFNFTAPPPKLPERIDAAGGSLTGTFSAIDAARLGDGPPNNSDHTETK